ncbi:MAG: hypothetical protein ABIM32_03465 [candidate division WOR-3 bacterium]
MNKIENELLENGVELITYWGNREEYNAFKRRFKFMEYFYEGTGFREVGPMGAFICM